MSTAQVVILDQTVFYPQGGGQPTDTGTICLTADGKTAFDVKMVREVAGVVHHYGTFSGVREAVLRLFSIVSRCSPTAAGGPSGAEPSVIEDRSSGQVRESNTEM